MHICVRMRVIFFSEKKTKKKEKSLGSLSCGFVTYLVERNVKKTEKGSETCQNRTMIGRLVFSFLSSWKSKILRPSPITRALLLVRICCQLSACTLLLHFPPKIRHRSSGLHGTEGLPNVIGKHRCLLFKLRCLLVENKLKYFIFI